MIPAVMTVGFFPSRRRNDVLFLENKDIAKGRNILFVATMPPFGGPGHPLPQDREVPWPQAATILIKQRFFGFSVIHRGQEIQTRLKLKLASRGIEINH